jgi:UDP-glucose 4-epimerase
LRVFLTGGTGLIGTGLKDLFARKASLTGVLTRTRHHDSEYFVCGNLADPSLDLRPYFERTDVVVHNAASVKPGRNPDEIKEIEETNVNATRRILDWAAAAGVKKIVFSSTFSSIKKPLPELITESSEVEPVLAYSKSKIECEKMIETASGQTGMKYSVLRISSPVAFNFDLMPENVVKSWIKQSMLGQVIKVYGDGSRAQDFVAVSDVADAFFSAATRPEADGIFNVASGTALSMLDLARMITAKFGNSFEFVAADIPEKWNISLLKSLNVLHYRPRFTAAEAISGLLNSL